MIGNVLKIVRKIWRKLLCLFIFVGLVFFFVCFLGFNDKLLFYDVWVLVSYRGYLFGYYNRDLWIIFFGGNVSWL